MIQTVIVDGPLRRGQLRQGTGYIHYGSGVSSFIQEDANRGPVGQGWPRNTVATSPDELPYPRSPNSRNPAQATNGCTNVPNASPMACNSHDVCYGTYGTSKELCDYQLHENMVTENWTWIGRLAAKIYYFGVTIFGRKFTIMLRKVLRIFRNEDAAMIGTINLACSFLLTPVIYAALSRYKVIGIIGAVIIPIIAANIIILNAFPVNELGAFYGLAAIFWSIMDFFVSVLLVFAVQAIIDYRKSKVAE